MSTKYCRVNDAPKKLNAEEMIISLPCFTNEIKKARRAKGQQATLTVAYLRAILLEVGASYDPEFNAYIDVNVSKYKGIAIKDEEEVSKVLFSILEKDRPDLIEKAITAAIIARKQKVKLIYFEAPDFTYSSAFPQNGIDSIKASEIADFLGTKKKGIKNILGKLHKEDGTVEDMSKEDAAKYYPNERKVLKS